MTTQSKEAQERAEANFRKKELQAREASKAMAEYEAGRKAEREKTARLRLLRQAKEEADAAAAAAAAEAKAPRIDTSGETALAPADVPAAPSKKPSARTAKKRVAKPRTAARAG